MRIHLPGVLLLLATMSGMATADVAAPPPPIPDWRLVLNDLLLVRYNPLGLEDQLRVGMQKRLVASERALFRDTFLFAGIYPKLNPAYLKIGPSFELQPLSIFNLRVAFEYMGFFDTFGYLQSFRSPLADYRDSELARGKDAGRSYATSGIHFMIEPLVQLRVGNLILRDKLALEFWSMTLHAGDNVWYDATLDTLVPRGGWVVTNDLDVLYRLLHDRLTLGARYSLVKPLYGRDDYQPGEETKNPNGHQRLGAVVAYTFFDRGFARWNKPTLLMIASWYFDHRWRTGVDVPQAVPYLVFAFSFQSDLMH